MEKTVPGSAGWTITGDRSMEFAKSPLEFLERRLAQYDSQVFLARALNKPTVFVCSNEGVREILNGKMLYIVFYRSKKVCSEFELR